MIKNGIAASRIHLKYFGVDLPADTGRESRAEDRELKLLYLGRFVDFKGPELVVQGFEHACRSGFQGRLVMAGDGPLLPMCELITARSKYQKRIQLYGEVSRNKASELMAGSDIFVCHHNTGLLSNRQEAFGVALIEAMSHGMPVLSGRSGGVSEIVEHEVNGLLIEPGNIAAFSDSLIRLQKSPALLKRLGDAARGTVAERFSRQHEEAEWRTILSNVTG